MGTLDHLECNLCGSNEFLDMRHRPQVRCKECGSLERTRVLMLQLSRLGVPKTGHRVLHFAPELALSKRLSELAGRENYNARDLDPTRYGELDVESFDLCKDSPQLPANHYDLIVHNHVLEHVPCNYSAVLWHLHRALQPTGYQVCSIPIMKGGFEDNWSPALSPRDRQQRYGQDDHVRRFGQDDLQDSLGMVFNLPETYDLEATFEPALLDRHNIPAYARRGFTGHSVLVFGKQDLKLQA